MTRDGILVCNHDECLKSSTDAILFDSIWGNRQTTYEFMPSETWCTDDYLIPEFTLAEIK